MEFNDEKKSITIKMPSTEKYVPVLIDIIKIIYGDKPDLAIPNTSASSNNIELQPETEKEDTVKINVNKPIEPERTKEETKIGRPEIPTNVQEEILRLHKDHRSQKFIINDIKTRFGLKISRNSVAKYGEKKEIDGQTGNKEFTKIKKKPTIKNIH